MDSKQEELLRMKLRDLISVQDEVTHLNENGAEIERIRGKQAVRTMVMQDIIALVDKWTCPKAA